MAYLVSQMRKDASTTYMTPAAYVKKEGESQPEGLAELISAAEQNILIKEVSIPSPYELEGQSSADIGRTNTFTDLSLQLLNGAFFSKDSTYYFRFTIKKVLQNYYSTPNATALLNGNDADADALNFILYLGFSSGNGIAYESKGTAITKYSELSYLQQIGTAYVPPQIKEIKQQIVEGDDIITCPNCGYKFKKTDGQEEGIDLFADPDPEYVTFQYVFKPKKDYNTILIKLNRTGYDILIQPRDWLVEKVEVELQEGQSNDLLYPNFTHLAPNGQISKLNNIIPNNRSPWVKMGYQSRPGSLIVINDQPIRVGRSGIYEINNGIKIRDFMIATPNGVNTQNIDAFLLDYAYQQKSNS